MAGATPDLRLLSQPESITAQFGRYQFILLGEQRQICEPMVVRVRMWAIIIFFLNPRKNEGKKKI